MTLDLRIAPPPAPGGGISGEVVFGIDLAAVPEGAYVQYLLNARTLCGPLTRPPYELRWHTAYMYDGTVRVQAVLRKGDGSLLDRSKVIRLQILNGGSTVFIVSPPLTYGDAFGFLPDPWSGIVSFELEGTRVDGRRGKFNKVTFWVYFDGILQRWSNGAEAPRVSMPENGDEPARPSDAGVQLGLDTRRYADGIHDLVVLCEASEPLAEVAPPGSRWAMIQTPVVVANGASVAEIRPRWREVYLEPGETLPLAPVAVLGEGRTTSSGPAKFTSSDESVASVDDSGNVTAHRMGFADIRVDLASSRSATVPVIVDSPDRGFPHFSRSGEIRTVRGTDSLYPRSMFPLGEREMKANEELTPELVKAAGINAWEDGIYARPGSDFDAWKQTWHEMWRDPYTKLATESGMPFVLIGDDMARKDTELRDSITNPASRRAIQHVFSTLAESNFAVSIEMVDEVTFLWGGTPVPTQDWETRSGPLDRHAFEQLMEIIDSVDPRPPITWQAGGTAPAVAAANWMGDPRFSDYASLYWTIIRHPYPYSSCLDQERMALDVPAVGWRPGLQRRAPTTLMSSASGPHYVELVEGEWFHAGSDRLLAPGVRPASCAAQIMYGAAMGMAGTRIYSCDTKALKDKRAGSKPPHEHQTGADALRAGTDRWQAVGSACNLVGRLESYLLQPQVSSVHMGPGIVTGARDGAAGSILVAVNFSECPRGATADLRPYRTAGRIGRYRLTGATLAFDTLNPSETDDPWFEPGETVVWVFPGPGPNETNGLGPDVEITSAPPNATVGSSMLARVSTSPGARRVILRVDGTSIATINAPARFETAVDTSGLRKGVWHSLSALCYDGAGNESEARVAFRPLEGQVRQDGTEQLPMSLAPTDLLRTTNSP
ncbi:MAG: Ig-like domain-containing protein [Actinomycetota bacterium]|nr:Ig-like domain-containing protein [Actinomycetota bacterium]